MWQRPNINSEIIHQKIESVHKIEESQQHELAWQELRGKRELTAGRLFLGKNRDDYTLLVMQAITGKSRIQKYFTSEREAILDFLDDKGEVIYPIP